MNSVLSINDNGSDLIFSHREELLMRKRKYSADSASPQSRQLLVQQIPNLSHMFLSGPDVTDGKPQCKLAVEARVRQQRSTSGVHAMHDCFIENIQPFRASLISVACKRRAGPKAH